MTRAKIAVGLWLLACILCGTVIAGNGFMERFDPAQQKLLASMDKYRYFGIYERGTCFLDTEQPADEYPEADCVKQGTGTSVLIVGDSYAAHLYPGLSQILEGTDYQLTQATKASCSYVLPYKLAKQSCRDFRKYVVDDLIPRMKPDIIIYSEFWTRIQDSADLTERMETAIDGFRSTGSRVVLSGTIPRFFSDVPRLLVIGGYTAGSSGDIWLPCRDDSVVSGDLQTAARTEGVQYVQMDANTQRRAAGSADRLFCLAATRDGPLHWDPGHMTLAGSKLYGAYLWSQISTP